MGLGPAAVAEAAPGKRFVRHADSGCRDRKGEYHVCAPWRLYLRSGRVIRLTEARMYPSGGRKYPAPFALSPHGGNAAYFRLKDGALVVRDVTTGKVRVVAGVDWSNHRHSIALGPLGRFVVLYRVHPGPYQIVDSLTGRRHTLPVGEVPQNFSPDNRYLLTRRQQDVTVYETGTWRVVWSRKNAPGTALHMDGTTVAYIDRGDRKRHRIRFFDLATGRRVGASLRLPAGEFGMAVSWDRANHLDVLSTVNAGTSGDRTTWRWRRANDGMRVIDTFVERSRRHRRHRGPVVPLTGPCAGPAA